MRTSQHMPAGPSYTLTGTGGSNSFAPQQQQQQGARPGMGISHNSTPSMSGMLQPGNQQRPMSASPAAGAGAPKKAGGSAFDFDDLFAASGAKGGSGAVGARAGVAAAGSNSMASLAAQKGSAQIWGGSAGSGAASQGKRNNNNNNNMDDLLF